MEEDLLIVEVPMANYNVMFNHIIDLLKTNNELIANETLEESKNRLIKIDTVRYNPGLSEKCLFDNEMESKIPCGRAFQWKIELGYREYTWINNYSDTVFEHEIVRAIISVFPMSKTAIVAIDTDPDTVLIYGRRIVKQTKVEQVEFTGEIYLQPESLKVLNIQLKTQGFLPVGPDMIRETVIVQDPLFIFERPRSIGLAWAGGVLWKMISERELYLIHTQLDGKYSTNPLAAVSSFFEIPLPKRKWKSSVLDINSPDVVTALTASTLKQAYDFGGR